jgi:hypothetical protein
MTDDVDIKQMLKELALDLKESYRNEIKLLEANVTKNQLLAVQGAKDMVVEVDKRQSKTENTVVENSSKIAKLFTIVDEIRDGYQQAVGAFKLWGMVCGLATVVSAFVAVYVAYK